MPDAELEIRRYFDADDMHGAMRLAIESYGSEIYGFLVGLAGNRALADDVFGATCERIWRALPKFRWESTLRAWAYTIARNELIQQKTSPARREVPISDVPALRDAIVQVRTRTPLHERTEVRERFARLREELEPDDHVLLGLRLEQKLPWDDIARVLGHGPDDLARASAVLRKRYQRLKERLRELVAASTADP